jgi:drug/metabolite transporter (DMT)-like permease
MRFTDPLGTGLAVASSLIWASYWLMNMNDKRELVPRLFYNFMAGSMLVGLYIAVMSIMGYRPIICLGNKLSSSWGLLGAAYVGVFEMGLTFILWNKALSLTDNTSKIANLIFLTPFLSLVFIALVLKESIHISTLLGLLLIICGNMMQKIGKKQQT